jgi:hypothetical protein
MRKVVHHVKKNSLLYTSTFLILILISFFYYYIFSRKDIEINLTNINLIQQNKEEKNIALYKKVFQTEDGELKSLYIVLDKTENPEFIPQDIQKIHSQSFWDPKVCSQMIRVIGKNMIILSDSFVHEEKGSGFITFLFFFDTEKNELISTQTKIPIQKLFYDSKDFFAISKNRNDEIWKLYKINIPEKKLNLVKKYTESQNQSQFGINFKVAALEIITATSSLLWCDAFNRICVEEKDFNFLGMDKNLKRQISYNNPFKLIVSYKEENIFELQKEDLIRHFLLGVQ